MAKKKRNAKRGNEEQLPEGMSRRQAKLAARAAERAAFAKDPRPYAGLAMEPDLVALQEFVPSAHAPLDVKGIDGGVTLATVLPGAVGALVRQEEAGAGKFVALQVQSRSQNPGRDLAYALNWLKSAKPGDTLTSTVADGSQPELSSLLDAATTLDITSEQDFNWWVPEGAEVDAQVEQSLRMANDTIMPSVRIDVDSPSAAWWVDAGSKAHIRWIRTEDEEPLLRALARIGAAGELNLGDDTKFAGAFRTHGVVVPVFDLDPTVPAEAYAKPLAELDKKIAAELKNSAALSVEERKALENIKSRQITIR